jgi:hypothetical protein
MMLDGAEAKEESITGEQAVVDIERKLVNLIRNNSHDMNNMIAAPYANIDMILHYCPDIPQVQRNVLVSYVEQAKAGIESAAQQIRDCFTKATRKKQDMAGGKPTFPIITFSTFSKMLDDIVSSSDGAMRYVVTAKDIHQHYPEQEQYERVQRIFGETVMGLSLTSKIAKQTAKISRDGDIEYVAERTSLNIPIEDAVMIYRGRLEKADISIESRAEMKQGKPVEFHFMGAYLQMSMVMINILANMYAILRRESSFAPGESAMILVDTRTHPEEPNHARISVINNGPYIDDPKSAFRYGNSGTGSSGIGVPACQYVMEKCFKGGMDLENLADKRGVAYHLKVPLVD